MCLWSDYKYRTACLQGTLEICYCSNISFRKMTHTQWFVPWEGLLKGLSDEETQVACSASKQLSFVVFSLSCYRCASSFILMAHPGGWCQGEDPEAPRVQPCLCWSPWLHHIKLLWVLWFSLSQFRMSVLKTPQTWLSRSSKPSVFIVSMITNEFVYMNP